MTPPYETAPDTLVAYDKDYALWLDEQVRLLREGRLADLDRDNLAEEIADVGRSERKAITSNMIVLMVHLLKCLAQPERMLGSWLSSIREHRRRLDRDFHDSPSLRRYAREQFSRVYDDALEQAADETRLPLSRFSPEPPFTFDEVCDKTWFPPDIADHL